MQVARFGANGAVAFRALDTLRRLNLKDNGAAVALARVDHRFPAPWNSKCPTKFREPVIAFHRLSLAPASAAPVLAAGSVLFGRSLIGAQFFVRLCMNHLNKYSLWHASLRQRHERFRARVQVGVAKSYLVENYNLRHPARDKCEDILVIENVSGFLRDSELQAACRKKADSNRRCVFPHLHTSIHSLWHSV